MRKVYIGIAWLVAAMVLVQAGAIALGFGGMIHFVSDGGVVDKALAESGTGGNFAGEVGFPIHSIVGGLVMPIAALVLVVLSWFTKVRGATWWAVGLFVLVVVQGSLGYSIKDVPYIGAIHGANALAVFVVAVVCARRAQTAPARPADQPATADAAA
jgi:heme A synthase